MTALIAFIVFIINIPFGFWRKSVKKFSFIWFVSIHVPVLISIGLRYISHIEFHPLILLLFVSVFFMGQFSGKYAYVWYQSKNQTLS
jgi:hypothetical protein